MAVNSLDRSEWCRGSLLCDYNSRELENNFAQCHSDSEETALSTATSRRLNAIRLYIQKPHVVNKKIFGAELKLVGVRKACIDIQDILSELHSILCKPSSGNLYELLQTFLMERGFRTDDLGSISLREISKILMQCLLKENVHIAIIRTVIPKDIEVQSSITEVIIIDTSCKKATFVAEVSSKYILPHFPYIIGFSEDIFTLTPLGGAKVSSDPGYIWLNNHLIPTLMKWSSGGHQIPVNDTPSLQLVNLQKYHETYHQLKKRHGKYLQQIWTEVTDPLKFIHEDLAIAAYLIVLWEQERKEKGSFDQKQSFLDLGCGNGLLVYILSSEGYQGFGIDLQRRKLWDAFPEHVCLKTEAILPSDKYLYPDIDWLIGNHSDELTPWLPVIAAKSSCTTRFFVIPCCAHDFQSKFLRKKSGISLYAEYTDFIEEVGNVCGFEVWKDRLRIPSTKRICLIGQNRKYSFEKRDEVMQQINDFISQRSDPGVRSSETKEMKCENGEKLWSQKFKSKEPIQKVRNCTYIKREIQSELVNDIALLLLSQTNFIKVERGDEKLEWNKGGHLTMKNLATALHSKVRHLKNECGGLQTFLRNHRFVFDIEKGSVTLRVPRSIEERKVSPGLVKTKRCWFFEHHPQGCVLKNNDCTYIH